jgi:6-methylsalicylate decarboxylase
VLSGFAAIGVSAATAIIGRSSPALANATTADKSWLIDVHHHFAPPSYVAENRSRVSPAALDWTP